MNESIAQRVYCCYVVEVPVDTEHSLWIHQSNLFREGYTNPRTCKSDRAYSDIWLSEDTQCIIVQGDMKISGHNELVILDLEIIADG